MRKLFMAIFIPVLVIAGTPALVATLMYDGSGLEHLPVHLYTDEYDAQEMLFDELDTSITEVQDGTTEDLVFNLSQDVINRAIYEGIREMNPDYAPGENCSGDECYIANETVVLEGYNLSFKVIGAWVSFYDGASASDPGRFVMNVMAEVKLDDGLTYQTVLEVHMLFDDDPEYYYLAFDKIQLGNLPLPKSLFSSAIGIAENQGNVDLQSEIDDQIPIGDFDVNTISYTLPKDEILTQISESNQGGQDETGFMLMQELLSIIFDNQLLQFDLDDTEFTLTAGVSLFRSEDVTDIPEYLYDLHDQEIVEEDLIIGEYNPELFDPEAYLTDVFTDFIFNNALLGGGEVNPETGLTEYGFEIEEEIFNKLIYSGAEGFADTRTVQTLQVSPTESKDIEVGLKAIWFEFEEEEIYAHALFRIAGIDSMLIIRADEVSGDNADELKFEFVEITFGKDADENSGDYLEIVDLEVFKQVFAELGDVEFGEFDENGDLIISAAGLSDLMQDGSEEGAVEVTGINLASDAIVLNVAPTNTELSETLADFQTALQDVIESEELIDDLEEIFDTTGGGAEQEVYEAVVDLQETLSSEEIPTEEQVEDLMDNFVELDEETQIEFLETVGDLIDPELLEEYGDLFGNFDQDGEVDLP